MATHSSILARRIPRTAKSCPKELDTTGRLSLSLWYRSLHRLRKDITEFFFFHFSPLQLFLILNPTAELSGVREKATISQLANKPFIITKALLSQTSSQGTI